MLKGVFQTAIILYGDFRILQLACARLQRSRFKSEFLRQPLWWFSTVWTWLETVLSASQIYSDIMETTKYKHIPGQGVISFHRDDISRWFQRHSQNHLQVFTVTVIMRWRWINAGTGRHIPLALLFMNLWAEGHSWERASLKGHNLWSFIYNICEIGVSGGGLDKGWEVALRPELQLWK